MYAIKTKKTTLEQLPTIAADTYVHNNETFCLRPDKHGSKHTSASKVLTKKSQQKSGAHRIAEEWKKGDPATFNTSYTTAYEQVLKNIIVICAQDATSAKRVHVDMCEPVGWDEGQGTSIIELYYNEMGSHIRPKYKDSKNSISFEQIIDVRDYLGRVKELPATLIMGASVNKEVKKLEKDSYAYMQEWAALLAADLELTEAKKVDGISASINGTAVAAAFLGQSLKATNKATEKVTAAAAAAERN